MLRILALGRRHRHRHWLRPVYREQSRLGVPIGSISQSVASPVAGGSSRSISVHAGTHNPDYCYDDEVTEQSLADCSDQPFEIKIGDSEELCERISIERNDMACKIVDFKNSGQHCIQNVEASSPEEYDQNMKASSPPKGYDQLVLYLMLRSMKRHFKNLVSMWKPRELMVFTDDLAKANEVVVGDPHFPGQAMQKWSHHLKGLPLFQIEWTEYTKKKVAKFGKIYLDESHGRSSDFLFHIKVEDLFKFDCLSGIIQAFGTINLSLFVNNIASKIKKYPGFHEELKRFVRFNSETRFGICSGFTYPRDEAAHKNLVVVFDAAIARELYYKDNAYHIIFVTAEEQNLINEMKIPELTALSFVHFNGVRYPLNDTNRKDEGEKPGKKGVGQEKVSSSSKSGSNHH